MSWCNQSRGGGGGDDDDRASTTPTNSTSSSATIINQRTSQASATTTATPLLKVCPSCGHQFQYQDQGLPAGLRFDPNDAELLEHLEAKARADAEERVLPRLDELIPTLEGENGICSTHPEKLPGVTNDGSVRHLFHRPSKAYTTGTRKRRKVDTDEQGGETRWHKTGKTRPILVNGRVKGHKKILVLYTNYGKLRKPEKTNWVMHQYHLGPNDEEKDGELVVSKVFYQTQPRQSAGGCRDSPQSPSTSLLLTQTTDRSKDESSSLPKASSIADYYNPLLGYGNVTNFNMNSDGSPFLQ